MRIPGGDPRTLLVVPLLLAAAAFGCSRPSTVTQDSAKSADPAVRAVGLTAESVLGPMPVPVGNPQTPEKAELGKMLWFDPRLSSTNQMACSSCHIPEKGFSDGLARNKDHKGEELARNSTSLWNSGYEDFPSWDGARASLEQHNAGALTRFRGHPCPGGRDRGDPRLPGALPAGVRRRRGQRHQHLPGHRRLPAHPGELGLGP